MKRFWLVGLLLVGVILALDLSMVASAQDSTSLLTNFLTTLRASHFTIGSGGTAPAVSTCGTGALATGSTDSSGRVTATGATACTVTFGASFGANSADCVVTDITGTRASMATTTSQTVLTITGMTSGDTFTYICAGR